MAKTELARAVGVSDRMIRAYETSEKTPSDETLGRLARALAFPEAFFEREGTRIPTVESASFRSLARLTARDRDAALAMGAIGQELSEWLDENFKPPPVRVPDLSDLSSSESCGYWGDVSDDSDAYTLGQEGAEAVARALRVEWGLGSQPIRHATKLMESRGVHVFSLAERSDAVDAFSLWSGAGRPLIFLNTLKSAERSRYDCCHELGHLVMHRRWGAKDRNTKEVELEADRFASAFLMPKVDLLGRVPRNPTLDRLVSLKQRWGVSVVAVVRRLKQLGQLTDWQYRNLMIEASQRGWRKSEPRGMRRETSVLLGMVLESMRKEGRGHHDIAAALCIAPDELSQLMLGLAIVPLPGGGGANPSSSPTERRRGGPQLTLIEGDG